MTATLLPLPDPLPELYQRLIDYWPDYAVFTHPRSKWLTAFETALRADFPQSSSRDRSLTARHYAPFPLAAGKDVP